MGTELRGCLVRLFTFRPPLSLSIVGKKEEQVGIVVEGMLVGEMVGLELVGRVDGTLDGFFVTLIVGFLVGFLVTLVGTADGNLDGICEGEMVSEIDWRIEADFFDGVVEGTLVCGRFVGMAVVIVIVGSELDGDIVGAK